MLDLSQISKRSPQFRGFQQHDAQELLRHLVEGLRSEETKRQKLAILKHFGFTEKTDPKSVPAAVRKKLQVSVTRFCSQAYMCVGWADPFSVSAGLVPALVAHVGGQGVRRPPRVHHRLRKVPPLLTGKKIN